MRRKSAQSCTGRPISPSSASPYSALDGNSSTFVTLPTLLEMNWAEHTYKWLVHTKFLAHLAVFSRFVCTAHHLVYRAHQLEETQHTSYNQVCTNHHSWSGSSTLSNPGVHQPLPWSGSSTLTNAGVHWPLYRKWPVYTSWCRCAYTTL